MESRILECHRLPYIGQKNSSSILSSQNRLCCCMVGAVGKTGLSTTWSQVRSHALLRFVRIKIEDHVVACEIPTPFPNMHAHTYKLKVSPENDGGLTKCITDSYSTI